jgi:hypothetical protein
VTVFSKGTTYNLTSVASLAPLERGLSLFQECLDRLLVILGASGESLTDCFAIE